jgi:hypothetical protein
MAKSVPVPWIQWQRYRITGLVREEESERPLPGLMVCAYDKDVIKDEYLGEGRLAVGVRERAGRRST